MRPIKHRPSLTNEQVRISCKALSAHILELSKDQATNLVEIIATIKLKEYLETFLVSETPDNSDAALLAKYLGANAPALQQVKSAETKELTEAERFELIGKKSSNERTEEETRFYLDYSMRQMIAMSKQTTISDSQL